MTVLSYRGQIYQYDIKTKRLTSLETAAFVISLHRFQAYAFLGMNGHIYVGSPDLVFTIIPYPDRVEQVHVSHKDQNIWAVSRGKIFRIVSAGYYNSKCWELPVKLTVVQFVTLANHYIALDNQGHVYSWVEEANPTRLKFKSSKLKSSSPVQSLSAGEAHVLALTHKGKVWAWGNDEKGQLGQGQKLSFTHNKWSGKSHPIKVKDLKNVTKILAHSNSCMALSQGVVMVWGDGLLGQLGLGNLKSQSRPTRLSSESQVVTDISLASDGVVYETENCLYLICYRCPFNGPEQGDEWSSPIEIPLSVSPIITEVRARSREKMNQEQSPPENLSHTSELLSILLSSDSQPLIADSDAVINQPSPRVISLDSLYVQDSLACQLPSSPVVDHPLSSSVLSLQSSGPLLLREVETDSYSPRPTSSLPPQAPRLRF